MEVIYKKKTYNIDNIIEDAIDFVSRFESTSYHQLQKALHVGYARVQRLVYDLDVIGITDSSGIWDGTLKKIKILIHSKEEGIKMLKESGPKFEKESLLIR